MSLPAYVSKDKCEFSFGQESILVPWCWGYVLTAVVEKKALLSVALQTPGHCRARTETPAHMLMLCGEVPGPGISVPHK